MIEATTIQNFKMQMENLWDNRETQYQGMNSAVRQVGTWDVCSVHHAKKPLLSLPFG